MLYQHPAAEHFTFAVLDDWRKEAAYTKDLVRVHDPARVTFRTARELFREDLGLRQDDAYWVRDVDPSGDGYADVDLVTHGCGGTLPVIATQRGGGIDPVPWVSHEGAVTGASSSSAERNLAGSLRGLSSVKIDVEGACLDGGAVTYDLETDGPVTVRFSDGRTIELEEAGHHAGVVAPA
jgi:hypothetical protein